MSLTESQSTLKDCRVLKGRGGGWAKERGDGQGGRRRRIHMYAHGVHFYAGGKNMGDRLIILFSSHIKRSLNT